MDLKYLTFDEVGRPYSQAVRVGPLLFTSGASIGGPEDDIEAQTEKSIEYLADILKRAGTDLQHVVKATVFLADIATSGRASTTRGNATSRRTNPLEPRPRWGTSAATPE